MHPMLPTRGTMSCAQTGWFCTVLLCAILWIRISMSMYDILSRLRLALPKVKLHTPVTIPLTTCIPTTVLSLAAATTTAAAAATLAQQHTPPAPAEHRVDAISHRDQERHNPIRHQGSCQGIVPPR